MRYRPKQIDTKSNAYFRLKKSGFDLMVNYEDDYLSGKYLPIILKCVCGTLEHGRVPNNYELNGKYDAAAYVENVGAVSIKHLMSDGYNKSDIMTIRKAYV